MGSVMKNVSELIESRISANAFDTSRRLSDEQIEELVRLATLAPSSFNAQNWKVIAVRTAEAKQRLKKVAYEQPKIAEAAVTFIICGTLAPHKGLPDALLPSVEQGIIERSVFDTWVAMANGMYEGNEVFQRDEAIRSASLCAMTLMLAAQGQGLASGPMIGFDPAGVAREFQLASSEVPVMLIAVGYALAENWPQKPRKALKQVLTLV
jgi:nitroreductase